MRNYRFLYWNLSGNKSFIYKGIVMVDMVNRPPHYLDLNQLGKCPKSLTSVTLLFDFYVDEVKFSDGTTYHAERFAKPLRTLNKY